MSHVESNRGVQCSVLCSALHSLPKIVCVCTVCHHIHMSVYALELRLRLRGHPPWSAE